MFAALLKQLTLVTIFYKLSHLLLHCWQGKVGPQGVSRLDYSWVSYIIMVEFHQRLAKGLWSHNSCITVDLESYGANSNGPALLIDLFGFLCLLTIRFTR
jgi:hypothetical protein